MEELLILSLAYNDVFTVCKDGDVSRCKADAVEYYTGCLRMNEENIVDFPEEADYWCRQADRYRHILECGFEAVTHDEYERLQRERWLNRPVRDSDSREYDEMLYILPPLNYVMTSRYSMFMVGECSMMTYHAQYLYDKESGMYYTAIADRYDRSTWLDKRLGYV